MAEIERVGRWSKSSGSYGNTGDYVKQAKRYGLEFLRHYFRLGTLDMRHPGGGDQPDGMLTREGQEIAMVEVRLHVESFDDWDQPNGSGWPQVTMAVDGGCSSPIKWLYPATISSSLIIVTVLLITPH